MSATGLEVFDTTLQETNHWLKLMMSELHSNSRRTAFNALRASLHAIRDRIGVNHAAHLGAQLPMLLRGAFYERWHPAETPTSEKHVAEFVERVASGLSLDSKTDPRDAVRACFSVMDRCLDSGEMRKLRRVLPHEIGRLWPETLVDQ